MNHMSEAKKPSAREAALARRRAREEAEAAPARNKPTTEFRRARRARGKQLAHDVEETTSLMPDDEETTQTRTRKRRVPKAGAGTEEDRRPRISVQLGKRWSEIVHSIKKGELTWPEFVAGLTPEELARGQLADKSGKFQGRPPAMVPREFHLECQRELRRRFNEKMQTRLLEATDEYIDLSRTVEDPKLREQMLRHIMDRVMGPPPKTVEVSTTPQHEGFLAAVIRADGAVDRSSRYDRRTAELEDEGE